MTVCRKWEEGIQDKRELKSVCIRRPWASLAMEKELGLVTLSGGVVTALDCVKS